MVAGLMISSDRLFRFRSSGNALPQLSESSLFRVRFAYWNKRYPGVLARPMRGIEFGSFWSFADTSPSSFSS
jgi:hypothetical protein